MGGKKNAAASPAVQNALEKYLRTVVASKLAPEACPLISVNGLSKTKGKLVVGYTLPEAPAKEMIDDIERASNESINGKGEEFGMYRAGKREDCGCSA